MINNANLPVTTPFVLSGYDICTILDHYIFKDPVSGYNIFYPLTAYGGPMSESPPFTFNNTVSGLLAGRCIIDFCYEIIQVDPIKIFCITTVNFILTGIDQSVSKVNKIVYSFGNNSLPIIVTKDFYRNRSPVDVKVAKTFYPTKQSVAEFVINIQVCYENSCISTYIVPVSAFGCSILDIYENTKLLNSQQTRQQYDVILTLEDQNSGQLFNNVVKTGSLIETLNELPYSVENRLYEIDVPVVSAAPLVPVPVQPVLKNPVTPLILIG